MKLSAYKFLATAIATTSCLVACGGGGGPVTPLAVVPAVVVPVVVVPTGANVLTVTAASNAARNGAYTVTGGRYTNNPPNLTDIGFNGNTTDGKFETDISVTTAGAIRNASVFYFGANNAITFYGCSGAVACKGIAFDSATQTISLANAILIDTKSTDTVTVNGTIVVPK